MAFKPTAEQLAIVKAAQNTKDNLIISALAGAAKTSTLELIAKALPDVNTVCLAFNKSIAKEMEKRLPSNCTAMTLNALGHRVWTQHLGLRRLNLKTNKMYNIINNLIEDLPQSDKTLAYEEFSFIMKTCGQAKSDGHLPDKFVRSLNKPVEPILNDDALLEGLEESVDPLIQSLIIKALIVSANESMQGTIDFGDQVLFPSLFRCSYPIFSLILVDESQDLSPLNHAMLRQLYRRRIIAVGDQRQAIYAFRGAFEEGMEAMQTAFDMRELQLSCSFRCPEEIVDHVRWRAPHMTSWSGTPAGKIVHHKGWSLNDIPEGSAVICRNNAPILSLAINLLKAGRYPNVWGNDIAAGLLKKLEKLGPSNMGRDQAFAALGLYHAEQKRRVKNHDRLQDTIDCLSIFIENSDTLGGAIAFAQTIFNSSGKIELMTGHKSKGHEFNNVYFLDNHLVSTDGQDPNLRYVICTRAMRELHYIDSRLMAEQGDYE